MKAKVKIAEVLNDIYAVSALTSISTKSEYPLLHPGHEKALARLVDNALSIVAAALKATSVERIDENESIVEFAGVSENKESVAATILRTYTASIARLTAMGCSPATVRDVLNNMSSDYLSTMANEYKPLTRNIFT